MAINFKVIENVLFGKQSKSGIVKILLEYSALKEKIDDADNQTWYFKKALDSHIEKLSSLNEDYEKIRTYFNDSSVDYLISELNENQRKLVEFESRSKNSLQQMVCSITRGRIEYLNELIRLKSKTPALMPLPHYLSNPEELLPFFE